MRLPNDMHTRWQGRSRAEISRISPRQLAICLPRRNARSSELEVRGHQRDAIALGLAEQVRKDGNGRLSLDDALRQIQLASMDNHNLRCQSSLSAQVIEGIMPLHSS